jgi:hypothetical protein
VLDAGSINAFTQCSLHLCSRSANVPETVIKQSPLMIAKFYVYLEYLEYS